MAENQKTFVKWLLIIMTLVYIIIVFSMWLGYGKITDSEGNLVEATLGVKFIITLGGALLVGGGWFLFNHQKKQDKNLNINKSMK